jgi:CheY-like chemotaxis protein
MHIKEFMGLSLLWSGRERAGIPMASDIPNSQLSILVAEDHPTNQMVVRHHLERKGHLVTIVDNGAEAVALCTTRRFDIIFMDLQMPVMDGIEACKEIRALNTSNRNIPIYAVTASSEPILRQTCINAGMTGIVTKPRLFERFDDLLAISGPTSSVQVESAEEVSAIPGNSGNPLDYPTYLARLDGDEAFAIKLLEGFILQNERLLLQMAENIQTGDIDALRVSAHTIKGGALNLAAADLLRAAADLEQNRDATSATLTSLLARVTEEHERIRSFALRISQTP